MHVVYDISVLGAGLYNPRARTGVARFVDNLRLSLLAEHDIELSFCAFQSLEAWLQVRLNSAAIAGLERSTLALPGNWLTTMVTSVVGEFYPKASSGQNQQLRRRFLNRVLSVVDHLCLGDRFGDMREMDIFHSPFFPLPAVGKVSRHSQRFITVHDMIQILFPQFFVNEKNPLAHRIVESIGPEDWVVTNSETTKGDLCDYARIDSSRVFVTPLAASKMFYRCTDVKLLSAVRERYGIPDGPYILSVATLEPRKNIDQVIRSFVQLVQEQHIEDLNLVLTGVSGWSFNKVFDEIDHASSLRRRIVVTGYVHEEDLTALYSGAMMFVYPSFYEGFGLPPLEAMQCGVPVITSNTSSLPEVVGDAGIMIDPKDGESLCQAMLDIFSRPSLRESLVGKSLERACHFSWENCAKLTVEAYRTALKS